MQRAPNCKKHRWRSQGKGFIFLPIAYGKSNSFCHERSQKIKKMRAELSRYVPCSSLSKEACLLTWSVGENASSTWWEFRLHGVQCTSRGAVSSGSLLSTWAAASPHSLCPILPCTLRGWDKGDRHDFDNLTLLPHPAQIQKAVPRPDDVVIPSLTEDVICAWPLTEPRGNPNKTEVQSLFSIFFIVDLQYWVNFRCTI